MWKLDSLKNDFNEYNYHILEYHHTHVNTTNNSIDFKTPKLKRLNINMSENLRRGFYRHYILGT